LANRSGVFSFFDDFAAFPTFVPVRILFSRVNFPCGALRGVVATLYRATNQQRLCHGRGGCVRTNAEPIGR
jgi:hypothetical protein